MSYMNKYMIDIGRMIICRDTDGKEWDLKWHEDSERIYYKRSNDRDWCKAANWVTDKYLDSLADNIILGDK